jgi:hypothetical protein
MPQPRRLRLALVSVLATVLLAATMSLLAVALLGHPRPGHAHPVVACTSC